MRTSPFLLSCAQMQLFSFINSGFFPVMHNPVLPPTQSLVFSVHSATLAVRSLCISFLYSASNNPAVRIPSHLPASQFCILLHLPASPSLPYSSCFLPSDGIIPVILSHYRSSDANGGRANPAAGKPGPGPAPALPSFQTAVPCSVMPMMHRGSQTQSRPPGC